MMLPIFLTDHRQYCLSLLPSLGVTLCLELANATHGEKMRGKDRTGAGASGHRITIDSAFIISSARRSAIFPFPPFFSLSELSAVAEIIHGP